MFYDCQAVCYRRYSHPLISGSAVCGLPLHTRLDVRNSEREIGNYCTARILYCTGDGAQIPLPKNRASHEKEENRQEDNASRRNAALQRTPPEKLRKDVAHQESKRNKK